MTREQEQVRAWMEKCDQKGPDKPRIPDQATRKLRIRLITEELWELEESLNCDNLVLTADALADLMYVVLGTAVACGIDLDPIFQEVHSSNMTKLVNKEDGTIGAMRRPDGKILKPKTYQEPRIKPLIDKQLL